MKRTASHGRSVESRARASSGAVVAAILALRDAGAHQKAIARELGVSQSHVSKVLARASESRGAA